VVAPAPLIAPFTSSQIIWALIAGYFVFGDLSDVWMLLGCTVIVASGLFVFYREAVLGGRGARCRTGGIGRVDGLAWPAVLGSTVG
jgi:drug/metabolite transporter (DMT)-like permease